MPHVREVFGESTMQASLLERSENGSRYGTVPNCNNVDLLRTVERTNKKGLNDHFSLVCTIRPIWNVQVRWDEVGPGDSSTKEIARMYTWAGVRYTLVPVK